MYWKFLLTRKIFVKEVLTVAENGIITGGETKSGTN